jgi:hypothetical protein
VLFVFWPIGSTVDFAGGLIHPLLAFAVILLIFNLLTGRRASA